MNNVLNENIIIFYFFIIVISLRSWNVKKKYKEKKYQNKRTRKEIVNVDEDEEIILQNDEHNDKINLDGVDYVR